MSVAKKSFVTGKLLVAKECCIDAIIPLHRNETRWLSAGNTASYFVKISINQYTPAASNPLAGIVISQEVMISSATLQRTLLTRSAEPTPMIAELTTCEVLTGKPEKEAARITLAELNCVAKLCRGRIL